MKIWLSILFFLAVAVLSADEPINASRVFDQSALQEYRDDPSFDYSSDYDKSGTWFTLLLIYLLEKLSRIFQFGESLWIMPYLFRTLAVVVILAVLYYILKNRFGVTFEREGKRLKSVPVVFSTDDKIDYDRLLKDALKGQAFKLAIRYQFLKTLHQLHLGNKIKIAHWKAPMDYLYEINSPQRGSFKELVDVFESTWYGDYAADESTYQQALACSNNLMNEKR